MTKSSKQKLAYQAEYQKAPKQVEKRVARNAARQAAIKAGTVQVGDGKDIDHKKPLENGGTNASGNTRVLPAKKNRGWRKGESGYDV